VPVPEVGRSVFVVPTSEFKSKRPHLLIPNNIASRIVEEQRGTHDDFVFVDPRERVKCIEKKPAMEYHRVMPSGVIAKEVLDRACSVMHSGPRGPIHLMLPREVLAQEWVPESMRSPVSRPVPAPDVADEPLDEIADRLLAAESPLLVTSMSLGYRPKHVSIKFGG